MKSTLVRLGLVALLIGSLQGCGGGGSDGVAGAPGTPGTNATTGVSVNGATLTAAQWKALKPNIDPASISVNMASGKPVVKFKVTDQNGNPVIGLGGQTLTAANAAAGLPHTNYNLAFTLAKLVPGTNNGPSKWVNMLVTTPKAAGTAGTVVNGGVSWSANFPQADNQGTLVDNGDGTYQYTFYRDVTQTAAIVAGQTDSGTSFKADLGDVSYAPTLTHRLGIILNGSLPGTGTATPNGVASATPAVPMVNTFNIGFDFVPNGGAVTSTRDIVKKDSCTECHAGKGIGHVNTTAAPGYAIGRNDPRLCVTCHTDQIKYTFNAGDAPLAADGVTFAVQTGTNAVVRPAQAILDGRAVGNYPNLVHKMHMGDNLIKQGYNFNNDAAGLFNEKKFPQDVRNCTKCHDGSATAVNKTTNGDNWKNVPSRLACGACHDGINFATGSGINADGGSRGHGAGGAQADDSKCSSCHDAASIQVYHVPVSPIDPTYATNTHTNSSSVAGYNSTNLPAGALKISFDLNSVTLNASKQPVLKFRFMNNSVTPAAPVVFNDAPAAAPSAANIAANNVVELMPNFVGGPSAYIMAALPQDGNATPADFNTSSSVYIRNCWNKVSPSTTCTMTGPVSGYYTLTMTGVTMPTSATMITGGMGFNDGGGTTSMPLTQTNVAGYPVSNQTNPTTGAVTGWVGGLNVPVMAVTKLVSGTLPTGFATQTARRVIVEAARCNNCHGSLGTFTSSTFHGGQRNDPAMCVLCHNPDLNNNGWAVGSSSHVHAIHAAGKRTVPFTWTATSATSGFFDIEYPGVLRNCVQCHLPGTVNFGNATNAAQSGSMQFRTAATGTPTAGVTMSPYVTAGAVYGAKYSASLATGTITEAAGTTLVNSPIANACFSCHTTDLAMAHMRANGGSLYAVRSSLMVGGKLVNNEQCLVCHGAGKVADAEVIHNP